jgi:hypothetical protein
MLFLVIADVLTSGSGFAAGSSELGGDRVVFSSLPAKFGNHKLKWLAIVSNNVTVTKKLFKKNFGVPHLATFILFLFNVLPSSFIACIKGFQTFLYGNPF